MKNKILNILRSIFNIKNIFSKKSKKTDEPNLSSYLISDHIRQTTKGR
ncbi:MAG: hypothetical protein N4A76_06035 [Firmicutes bacterium]|jgi:DNA-directed RNA polymerase specialized sigma54-like protein|nr:hypothetical protein [Bacillota bacterium]